MGGTCQCANQLLVVAEPLGFNVWRGHGVEPAPPHSNGLRHWTVLLPSGTEIASVRARAHAAGVSTEPIEAGFLTRDPWENAVAFLAPPTSSPSKGA